MESGTPWLFVAGDGAAPPALTGRDVEQAVLSRCLAGLRGRFAPPRNVVLVGPRGNGKTVLLRWFEHTCAQREPNVDVIPLTPSDLPNRAALVDALVPRSRLAKLLPRKVGIASVGSAEWSSSSGPKSLTEALIARCHRRPLALLLDEAHTLDLDVGRVLLNASQQVRGAEAPFLLVLAGTPGLPAHLDAMDASFWSRLGEGELGIGRLSEVAARQALTKPLQAHGVSIDADALAFVVAQSQRYPYFIQLWGDALWQRHLATGTNTLATEFAEAVQPAVAAQVANYYQRRFVELESEGLVPAAAATARLFQGDASSASDQEMDAALAAAGIDDATERHTKREALNRLGYVWRPPNQQAPFRWYPGIPSLMAHVLQAIS